jgi:Acetyl xylan esterase (AXE1)
MKKTRFLLGVALVIVCRLTSLAGDVPKTLDSAACRTAPTIDGIIQTAEWNEATLHRFDLSMVRIDPPASETRSCELRVMNSANALYIALRVPDETIDNSLSPFLLDAAILGFCQGEQVRARDDRKLIAHAIYRDKHVGAPGKGDDDDAHQDGRGAMTRDNGVCSFEWAIPLDSGDSDDLRAKPGESFRFNIAYFDAFQLPLTKARMGGIHGVQLDRADAWGTLRLASKVKDDGGTAFEAPPWVRATARMVATASGSRLRVTDATLIPASIPPTAKVQVSFTYLDEKGVEKEAKGKLYLTESIRAGGSARFPLCFNAGYELPDGAESAFMKQGWLVVSPRELPTNPLIRNVNPDVVLLHVVRALPFVDDARVIITGGSAGGWMTLMLAAETFPLAGAAPDVPPVNWGFNGAYFFKQLGKGAPKPGGTPRLPAFFTVGTMLGACRTVYGTHYDDENWFAHSPIAHIPTITCPVSVYWTTADMLVPMNQVGARWAQPFDKSKFPEGFTMDPAELMNSREGRLALVDVLAEGDYEVFKMSVPEGTARHNVPGGPGKAMTRDLPTSVDKLWSIGILDEGAPEPGLDHRKFDLSFTRTEFLKRVGTGKISVHQLTLPKLERLMDRYAGKEWLPSRLKHLDSPENERADVIRGLKTYVSASPENLKRFTDLYAGLPTARRMLEPTVIKALETASAFQTDPVRPDDR